MWGYRMEKTLLLCVGPSGSGKSTFIHDYLPFYALKSATTRPMRDGESNGNPYYFVDESYFDKTPMATRLWVNEQFWTPGKPKWLYGVPEFEILENQNISRGFVYDVIEPKYARQMLNWFATHRQSLNARYVPYVLYFLPPQNSLDVVKMRQNMPDDIAVRQTNTCTPMDFLNANLDIDYLMNPIDGKLSQKFIRDFGIDLSSKKSR